MKSGINQIAEERAAHFTRNNYTPEHDDQHTDGALAYNAAVLACAHIEFVDVNEFGQPPLPYWGLDDGKDRTRCLVIAGALIAAEIDRLGRIGK